MREEKVKKIETLGFDVSEPGRNGEQFVYLQSVPTKDQAVKLLRVLSFED